jgi:hypothetical protein
MTANRRRAAITRFSSRSTQRRPAVAAVSKNGTALRKDAN